MKLLRLMLSAILLFFVAAAPTHAQIDEETKHLSHNFLNHFFKETTKQLSHDMFKQLIEINPTDSVGSTTVAAKAMAKRLRDAGFPATDIFLGGPNDRKGNLVARLHGTGAHKPILFICHLDVVEARREDWTLDP